MTTLPTAARPHSLSPGALALTGWIAFILTGGIFLALAWDVATHNKIVILDAQVANWLHQHASPPLTTAMLAITYANSIAGTSLWSVLFAFYLARRKEWYWMLSVALAVGGGMLLNVWIKNAYERARPHFDDPFVTLQTFSFPSGHTAGATLFYGVLAAYLVSRVYDPRRRAVFVAGAALAIVLVAFSRIYLGAHYLSDVLAAACSSLAWLVLCLAGVRALVHRSMEKRA